MTDIIFDYQELGNALRKLDMELQSNEERKRRNQLSGFLKSAEESLRKMEKRAGDVNALLEKNEAALSGCQTELTNIVKQMDSAKTSNQAQTCMNAARELETTLGALLKEIGALQAEAEELAKSYEDYKNKVPQAQKQLKKSREILDAERAKQEPQRNELLAKMNELVKKMDPYFVDRYQKLTSQNIFPPFVRLTVAGQCGGCLIELPMQTRFKLDEKGYIECDNCRRVILK